MANGNLVAKDEVGTRWQLMTGNAIGPINSTGWPGEVVVHEDGGQNGQADKGAKKEVEPQEPVFGKIEDLFVNEMRKVAHALRITRRLSGLKNPQNYVIWEVLAHPYFKIFQGRTNIKIEEAGVQF